ncbi:MAG: hypothetical protein HZA90_17710 [Verrucomicrobia bacterium]|nr:hypothetical protein [Verrucomicrobiota bacterium]
MNTERSKRRANTSLPARPDKPMPAWKGFLLTMLFLAAILAILFHQSFKPEQVIFANDGPLAVMMTQAIQVPESFTGYWPDLNWVGSNGGSVLVSITYFIFWALGPLGFAKFYAPLALLILGAGAWVFFRSLDLEVGFCGLGAIAAALNMNFFSNTCWGLGTRSLTLAAAFLALAALNARRLGHPWLNAALAGVAVGLGIIEGADNGAIFSLFIGAYVVFQSVVTQPSFGRKLLACGRLVLIVGFAGAVAVQALGNLVGLGIKGVASAQQDAQTKAVQWHFATQWSLPKVETLRVIIPGLFGYRMDAPAGGEYWGGVGRYAPTPEASWRSSGAGEYAGVLVVLIGCWAVCQSLRRSENASRVFSRSERLHIWFWVAMLAVAVVLSWGRHAPFYRLLYALPFFSTIRNPNKFMHPGHMALLILFGYGLLGLSRCYLKNASARVGGFKVWWAKAALFEKRWLVGGALTAGLAVLAWLIYAAARSDLVKYLATVGFEDVNRATLIARFSVNEAGLFVVVLLASLVILALIQAGRFAGRGSKWAVAVLGLLLTLDLARADAPWILAYNHVERYANHPLLQLLKDRPHLQRVTVLPSALLPNNAPLRTLDQLYRGEWLQYQFPFYGIQALDLPQEPRPPAYKTNYLKAVGWTGVRLWELTNVRYILGLAGLADALNQQFDPVEKRFRTRMVFDLVPAGNTAATATNNSGAWALLEFTGALPRAKLYSQWQVVTNVEATLARLGAPAFRPAETVLVSEPIPPPASDTNVPTAGSVEFVRYAPKHIELKVSASAPAVLLLNDRWDPSWKVWVDNVPAPPLTCNAIMRGVQVPAGDHAVTWRFQPPLGRFKISCAAMALGVVLCGLLFVVRQEDPEKQARSASQDVG